METLDSHLVFNGFNSLKLFLAALLVLLVKVDNFVWVAEVFDVLAFLHP